MSKGSRRPKTIAIEEHFSTPEHIDLMRSMVEGKYPGKESADDQKNMSVEAPFLSSWFKNADVITRRLTDTGADRLAEMDEAGVDMQVLSLISPGVQIFDAAEATALAKRCNDKLRDIIREHPDRYSGLAAIAPQSPAKAADELERAVTKLGLKGACINSHTRGEYLDDRKFWAIFERAEKLDVPIYIHPRAPSPEMIKPFLAYAPLPSLIGFGVDTGLHVLRLICSGVFDAYPKLKIILGHLGEALPFWLFRINSSIPLSPIGQKLSRTPMEYFRQNFYYTTSGTFWQPALTCTEMAVGLDRVIFAVDHPFQSNKQAVEFIASAPMSDSDREKVCHGNAEKLLRL